MKPMYLSNALIHMKSSQKCDQHIVGGETRHLSMEADNDQLLLRQRLGRELRRISDEFNDAYSANKWNAYLPKNGRNMFYCQWITNILAYLFTWTRALQSACRHRYSGHSIGLHNTAHLDDR